MLLNLKMGLQKTTVEMKIFEELADQVMYL